MYFLNPGLKSDMLKKITIVPLLPPRFGKYWFKGMLILRLFLISRHICISNFLLLDKNQCDYNVILKLYQYKIINYWKRSILSII